MARWPSVTCASSMPNGCAAARLPMSRSWVAATSSRSTACPQNRGKISGHRSALWPVIFALSLVPTVTVGAACAQQPAALEDLAKLRANPLSGLRTVTLQDQVDFDFPSTDHLQNVI